MTKPNFARELINIPIEAELKQSYLDYSMSVIVGRALPDVRDGLKPVHRRVLFAMHELSNEWNKPYKKSARIVGDVIGKYHPHGDTAVYDTIVRLAQPFSLRYPLIDGQGNFGSVDGDSPAAMRYTEIRLAKISQALLSDLDKNTVDFQPNYDETEFAPVVLPTRFPNLLVNGSAGIAVGMATNIPPHNLTEVIDACIAMIDRPEITIEELIKYIPGPDFPTAGFINGRSGIHDAYRTGRGRLYIRSRVAIETDEKNGKEAIIISELPYQVNKALLQERIGELVKEKTIDGITAIRDESDKDGMRVVIELRRGENSDVILNNLFTHTQMQVAFGINMVALDNGQPRLFNLQQMLEAFLLHRREVVTRRTAFELNKARQRAHILEGLGIALANIDEIVALIKAAKDPQIAKDKLLERVWEPGLVKALLERSGAAISRPEDLLPHFGLTAQGYRLSEAQAQAILDLRLHRLTGLEQEKITNEYKELLSLIEQLLEILADSNLLMKVIREELLQVKSEFADARRTVITESTQDLTNEDLIPEQTVVLTVSHQGYAKTQPLTEYQAQRRGGKGKSFTRVKEEDFVEHLLVASSHDTVLCFSNRGKVYWLKVYLLPQGGAQARGKPIINLLPLEEGERLSAILPVKGYDHAQYVFMTTANGTVKKVSLEQFSRPRTNGIIAVELRASDYLVGVTLTDGQSDIMLFSDAGKAVRFNEDQVRPTGRTATGVRGMKLKKNEKLISLIALAANANAVQNLAILTTTENGYGKRTLVSEYSVINRGGQGVISIQVTERNGKAVGAIAVGSGEEIMLISDQGTLVRTRVDEISIVSRNTQGVRLISIAEKEKLIALARIADVAVETAAVTVAA